jgi:type II secretory pathway pseudopilin PulG
MAVVAIMGILATLGIAAFNRRAFASSVPDAQVVLRAIGVAEERYRSMNQSYLDVSSSPGNAATGWYPVDPVVPVNQKVSFVAPAHPDYAPALPRRGWRHLNAPVTRPVGFTFKVNAGLPVTPIGNVALASAAWSFAANAGTDPWYVAQAHADGNGDGTYCVLVATSFTPAVRIVNEGD